MIINRSYKDINPLVCGWQSCPSGHEFGPAIRTYYLLHYVLSGKGVFQDKSGSYTVKEGQLFIINPFETTFYKADDKDPWSYIWIGFECGIELPEALKTSVTDAKNCEHIFTSLKNMSAVEKGRETLLCSKIFELFSLLSSGSPKSDNRTLEYILKAKNYIDSKYAEEISISQLSRYLGLERSYFSHLFTQHIGVSPQRYLVDLRLTRAAELISSYGYSPSAAAMSCGYKDIVNFSRMFKRRFGVPASKYSDSKKHTI